MSRGRRRAVALPAILLLAGCADLVQSAQDLTDRRTGRTLFVRVPAHTGGFAGFGLGLPVCIVLLPVSWAVHEVHARSDPSSADALSTLLWPSFVLWRTGNLLAGAPFDAVEWAAWRAWRGPTALTSGEREELEAEVDAQTLPSYPVQPVYPPPERAR